MRPKKPVFALSIFMCLIVAAFLLQPGSRIHAASEYALQFDGVDDRVTFGPAAGTGPGGLGAQTFTLELWFMRTGAGVSTSTGTGGLTAVPLVTKGVAQAEGSNVDMNYFLGIDAKTRVLAADFEDMNNGLNHPVYGQTAVADNIWYHAAATYDGTTWRLYLNGQLEAQLAVTGTALVQMPRWDSIQHAGLGTAMTSTGTASGFFKGQMDEVRIWNVARTQADIISTMNQPMPAPPAGVIGRWGLDDGTGTTAVNGVPGQPAGSLLPLNVPPNPAGPPVWIAGGSNYTAGIPPAGDTLRLTGPPPAGDFVNWERGPFPLTTAVLGTPRFTVETWFKREGTGAAISTGTGGIASLIPLVSHGRGEAEASNKDFNYILGINTSGASPVLAADFEEGATGTSPGLNHPLSGTTALVTGTWYHGAVTYDGTTLAIYLNGVLESSIVVGQPPRSDSIQPAALGSALDSTGAAAGFFAGSLDETRIWSEARTASQIAAGVNREIPSASNLLARWSYNEGFGKVVDSTNQLPYGLLNGTGWSWVTRTSNPLSPVINQAPVVDAGPDQTVTLPASGALAGVVTDDGVLTGSPLVVAWSKKSGPAGGIVTFGNPASGSTNVNFSVTGTYVLTLAANDGERSASDDVTITVNGTANQAPVVDAGADQAITLPIDSVALSGTATDDGFPGPLTTLWSKVSGPGPVTFVDATAAATTAKFSTEGTYVLKLTASDSALSSNDTLTITVNPNATNKGLLLGGTNAYVTFGAAPALGASKFTIETWFRRDGQGIATFTGTGGVTAIPLVTKGMAEAEGSTVDMNYFLGIDSTSGKLVADFEDTATGLNHPVSGTTPIPADGLWRHAAATYDGATWFLYLNGVQDGTLAVGNFTPQFNSIQHAALGTALNSAGVATAGQTQGFFNGALDEARIWNYARSAAQVANGRNREIPSASGLLGRWGLNEGTGTSVGPVAGTIVGTNFSWVSGAHITGSLNAAPVVDAGPDHGVTLPSVPMLTGSATDDAVTATPVTTLWTQVSGPAAAVFGTATNAVTTVDFPALGTYVLRLTANDGELSAFDDIQIVVDGVVNQPPVVDAGADQTITLPNNAASLAGVVTDDGVLPGGPVTTQWSKVSGPGAVTFANATAAATTATFSMDGAYTLRLSATDGAQSSSDTVAITVAPDPANKGLKLNGTNAYVTLGPAPGLGAPTFTLETWFRRDGAGIATFTGTGGVTAIPLVTKGMAETEGGNVDMNYFLGIDSTSGKLVADFEDTATGLNHPVSGATVIPADGVWRHAAATYDGTTWHLYLNGVQDGVLVVGNFTPRADSIQHAALGTALNSTGGVGTQTQGFFNGALDEARIWNYARSAAQISHGRLIEIPVPVPGLLGRWGLNDGSGAIASDSSGAGRDGTIAGSAYSWTSGAPFANPGNHAPSAVDDAATTNEDAALTISVLANDTDADADALGIIVVGGATHGTAFRNADGTVSYTPAANFNGTDSFTYSITDAQGGSASATVQVTINAVNDAPQAADDAASTTEDQSVLIPVLANDTDIDGSSLTPIVVSNPAHGTATVEEDGRISYVPAADFNGIDSFTYKVSDGASDSNAALVTITIDPVNDAPTAAADAYSVDEDTMLVIEAPGVLGNDGDADGDSLSATIVSDPSHGSLTLNADGSFIYTPNADYNGGDSFIYRANDGNVDSPDVTVTLTVNAVNDTPVAGDDSFTTDEDTAVVAAVPGVLANDSDADGDTLQAAVLAGPAHGTLALHGDGSFTYTPALNFNGSDSLTYTLTDGHGGSATGTVTLTINAVDDAPVAAADSFSTDEDTALSVGAPGVLANDSDAEGATLTAAIVSQPAHGTLTLNADGSFAYTPAPNFNGIDSFTYRASDGALLSTAATASITVNAVNDAPLAVDDTFSIDEDTVLTVAAPGVLGNDSDVDSSLTAILVNGPANGTLTFNANGSFVYKPDANFNGVDGFSYTANDGSVDSAPVNVTITVNGVTDALLANDDAFSTSEDTALDVTGPGVLGNDTEGDAGSMTALLVTNPAHGTLTLNPDGSFTYTPALNFNGSDSFTYRISDGTALSNVATVTITVVPVVDAPVAADNSYTKNEDVTLVVAAPGLLRNDRDPDGRAMTAVLSSGTSHGTLALNADGSFVYTPATNFNGIDSFTYRVFDGVTNSNDATVTITVKPINDAPVAGSDSYATDEDTTLTVAAPGLLANDSDVDSPSLHAVKASNPSHGTVIVNSDGSFVYTPALNYHGPDSFTYKARDEATGSLATTVTLTVNSVADAPVAASQVKTFSEDTKKAITLTATDGDGDPVTFQIVTQPLHGTLTGTMPNLTYTPTLNYNGTDSFTFKANDGALDSNVAVVGLTITPVNDAPVAQGATYTTPGGTALSGQLVATDVEGDPLTYAITNQPNKGTVSLNPATGAFIYTPTAGKTGSDSFRFRANDGKVNSNAATISIQIQ